MKLKFGLQIDIPNNIQIALAARQSGMTSRTTAIAEFWKVLYGKQNKTNDNRSILESKQFRRVLRLL